MNKVKSIFQVTFVIVLILLGVSSYSLYKKNQRLRYQVEISTNNNKAYSAELSSVKKENLAFKMTIDQLSYYNDSIISKMREVQKELEIKDKNLQSLQYILSQTHKKDSVILYDTIFQPTMPDIDTLVGDKWVSLKLGLRYPNKILWEPTVNNECYVIVHGKKETIKPPKKFFLWRWFQKKHFVSIVDVYEKNPWTTDKQQRFIEIIKQD